MSIESISPHSSANYFSGANWRTPDWVPAQTVEEVITHVRKATATRAGFAPVIGVLACSVLPWTLALAWTAFILVWELWLRLLLEDRLAAHAAKRSQMEGFRWLAAIHFVGATVYCLFPALLWRTGEPIGLVLATVFICGSANHLFVYFASNRLVMLACLAPVAGLALLTPLLSGLSIGTGVSIAALACLILGASFYGFDRNVLLRDLASQAAARASAEQANVAKSQFLATMSHELRTPLNAVIGYAELIEEEAEAGAMAADAGKIRASARQLLGVIDVILDISKLESGGVGLNRERVAVGAVLEHLRIAAQPMAAANNNSITFNTDGALGEADIDHVRLHQCLLHLISNAAKFTRDGAIIVSAARRDGELVFAVRDTGIGISEAQQREIFEPFVQVETDAARRYEGSGLGLTLVRRLARLMGGDVSCESAPGQGSTFTLRVSVA
ncbi:sensor histidine kinase [Terricaulis sp.]|uniref:sensor histidine kinase n=1 Tax=Terricaulis sp. TaxID=2768686 RepID=UPI003784020B